MMTITKTLGEIVRVAPTRHASVSALYCLRGLARDLDYDAIRELARILGSQLAYKTATSEYERPQTLEEFISSEGIPGLLRIYVAGFCPRCLVLDHKTRAQLRAGDRGFSQFAVFQSLLRRSSPIEHEVLKAYVLALCAGSIEAWSPASFGSLCDKIMERCQVVEGRNASSDFEFGRELLLEMTIDSFIGVVGHELGHNRGNETWSQTGLPIGRRHLREILRLLPTLKRSASNLVGQSWWMEDDPRRTRTKPGLHILYSIHRLDEGVLNHISLSNRGGSLTLYEAAIFSYLILCALGVEPSDATMAYSPRGLGHLAFLVASDRYDGFARRKIPRYDTMWLDRIAQDGVAWLDQLKEANRIGEREEDLLRILSKAYDQPSFYGPGTDLVALDIEICDALRSGMSLDGMADDDLDGLLCSAVRCGDAQLVETLLSAGASLGATALKGDPEIAYSGSSLLVREMDRVTSYFGPTATSIFGVMQALLCAGFDIDSAINDDRDTLLIDATKCGVEPVRFLLAHGADIDRVNGYGETALQVAAAVRDIETVRYLIKGGAELNKPAHNGCTPLLAALQEGADDIAQLLIDSGADVTKTTGTGESVLMFAASSTIAQVLCDAAADVDAATWEGETALMRAATWGGSEVVKALLDAGADVSAVTDLGETALHCAMWNPHRWTRLEIAGNLIEAGADVNAETNDGLTALILALESYVQTACGGPDYWTPLSSHDPLDARMQMVYDSYVDTIESDGVVALDPGRERREFYGRSLYNSAIARRLLARHRERQASVGDELAELMLFYEDLMQSGMEWRAEGVDASLARLDCDKALIRILLEAGADVTATTMEGESPLSLVEELEHDDDVRVLIEGARH